MKRILLIVLPLLLIVGCSKPVDEITLIEKNGLKYLPDSDIPYSGEVVLYYENGQKNKEGTYKDGERDGEWTYWFMDGKQVTGTGKTYWYKNGQKASERLQKENGRFYFPPTSSNYDISKRMASPTVDPYAICWDEDGNECVCADDWYGCGKDSPYGKYIGNYKGKWAGVIVGLQDYGSAEFTIMESGNAKLVMLDRFYQEKATHTGYISAESVEFIITSGTGGPKSSSIVDIDNRFKVELIWAGVNIEVLFEKKKNGKEYSYYKDGQKKEEKTYLGGKLDGKYIFLYENGQKKVEGNLKNGKKDGLWTCWLETGKIKGEITYRDGKEDRLWTFYNENGQKMPDGLWTWYHENGKVSGKGNFKNGTGKWTGYYKNGKRRVEGAYKDGKLDGKWTYWYTNGRKEKECSFVTGEKGQNWRFWDKNGKEIVSVTDIDGNTYKTVKIGEQWWMAENLKVTRYRNGEPITHLTTKIELSKTERDAYCIYKNDENIVDTYGLLYNGYAVNDMRGLAPEGWHVPSSEEWKQLEMYLGMTQSQADYQGSRGTIAGKLKEEGTNHWKSPNTGASNQSGFTALPAGEFSVVLGDSYFWHLGYRASFWSTSNRRQLYFDGRRINIYSDEWVNCFSVRCVKD